MAMDTPRTHIAVLIAAASCSAAHSASASDNTVFLLQGTAESQAGFDTTHAGPSANFFQGFGETGLSAQAADFADGAHFPDFTVPFPAADGIVDFAFWDMDEDPIANQGAEVINRLGQVVYRDADTEDFVFYHTDADAAGSGDEKLYYDANNQSIGALSFGNYGTQPGASSDAEYAAVTEFSLQGPVDEGFGGADLISATFTIYIDDVIDFGLTGSSIVALPSQAFVNVYEGEGDLTTYESVQSAFDLSDESTAADTVDLEYVDPVFGTVPVTDFALGRAAIIGDGNGNTLERLQFDFDVTDEVVALLNDGADFAGIVLGSTDDGDFTLGSIDAFVLDTGSGEVLENYLPSLTLEFSSPALEGDYNGDGFVSQGDLDLVLLNWGDVVLPQGFVAGNIPGGSPFDELISQNELDGVLLNWGEGTAPSLTVVPEPSGLIIGLMASAGLVSRRGGRHAD